MSKAAPRAKGATWDRAVTEASLETAALKLLNDRGILAGLNLREVADEAGVNRGLVYHYFGGGRDLLRSALRKDMDTRMREMGPGQGKRFGRRAKSYMQAMTRQAEWVRLVIILMLDHDDRVRLLPLKDAVLPDLHARQARGEITDEVDIEAFHVLQVVSGYGYALTRQSVARELGMDLAELDRRVAKVAEWIGDAMEIESTASPEPT